MIVKFSLSILCSVCLMTCVCTSSSWISTNTGKWELIHSDTFPHAAGIRPIVFDNNGEGWILSWAELSRVQDYGRKWTPVVTSESGERAFYSFTFTNPSTGFIVGTQKKNGSYNVLILQSTDGGAKWVESSTDVRPESDRNKAPILISVSVAPVSYFFWACAPPEPAA